MLTTPRSLAKLLALVVLVFGLLLQGQLVFASSSHNSKKRPVPPSDSPTLVLMIRAARNPELMNVRYLSCVLGRPTTSGDVRDLTLRRYFWYDQVSRRLRFELTQREPVPGRFVQSRLVAFTPNLKDDLSDIENQLGVAPNKFFDQQISPNIKYSLSPNTTIDFRQPHDVFHVAQMTVSYAGEGLPSLTDNQWLEATTIQKARALAQHEQKNWPGAISALHERVSENPADMTSRLALAESFRQHCNVNEAISEYRSILSQTTDPAVARTCVDALTSMKVLEPLGSLPVQKDLRLVRHGQGLTRAASGDNGADLYVHPVVQFAANSFDPLAGF